MEVTAKRNKEGSYELEMGMVTLELSSDVLSALQQVIDKRLNDSSPQESEMLEKKVQAYRVLATRMAEVDNRIVQKFAPKLNSAQLITMVRLAQGDTLRNKILANLSKQNRRQFEEDEAELGEITYQHACTYMEQIVPLIKQAAQEQKALQAQ
ncbi:MAG: hypothetical protein JXK16_09285 [Thiotrichales bacterium]|nr:hypothetical protein [Thiotrichales bacterium]